MFQYKQQAHVVWQSTTCIPVYDKTLCISAEIQEDDIHSFEIGIHLDTS